MNEINLPKIASGLIKNTQNTKAKQNANSNAAIVTKAPHEAAVVYKPSKSEDSFKTYDKQGHVYNKSAIDELKAESNAKLNELKNTVKAMLEKQGFTFKDIEAILDGKNNDAEIKIDDETRAKAIEAVSEDGFYGVKNTSERILDFAKHISGDDPAKYEQIKQSIIDGFEAAKDAFGGELPEISQKTYDAVMEGLDEWGGKTKA